MSTVSKKPDIPSGSKDSKDSVHHSNATFPMAFSLPPMAVYDGRTDPKDWIRMFEKRARAYEWDEEKSLNMAFAFLEGEADKWLLSEENHKSWT